MSHLFVSHATADDAAVTELARRLNTAGVATWIDHEHGIEPSDDWGQEIHDAANTCGAGLFVLSPHSAQSSYCRAEWTRILALGRRLYIARIADVPTADVPLRLGTIQYSDLTVDYEAGLAQLIAAILNNRDLDPDAPTTGKAARISGDFPRWQLDLPLIGRDDEFAAAHNHLSGANRITQVLGLGGIGKTRLASELAARTAFADGVVWHTVSPDTTVNHLTLLVRDHLRLPTATPDDAIWSAAGQSALLIVMDNAEDCRQPAAYAARLNALDTANGARVLVTSRVTLPDLRNPKTLDLRAPSTEAAVEILRAMAAAEPPAHPIDGHETALAEAARRHPKLLWYVTHYWLNAYPPDYVIAQVLTPLKGADAQEALEDLIVKTLRQLEDRDGGPAALAALRRLAVCRGGFTFPAALALMSPPNNPPAVGAHRDAPDSPPYEVGRGQGDGTMGSDPRPLRLLTQFGFVTLIGGRYDIDPLVVAAAGTDETAHRAHYDYYRALAQEHDKKQDYAGLDPESANLEASFEWAMAVGKPESALNIANDCAFFLSNRGRFNQRMDWFERLANALENHPYDLLRANALNSLGVVYMEHPFNRHDNLKRAIITYRAALVYRTPQAASLKYAQTQNNLGNAYADLATIEEQADNLKRAIAAYDAALTFYTPQAAPLKYAQMQNNLGVAYADLAQIEDRVNNLKRAIAAYNAALTYYTPQTAPLDYAMTHNNLGVAYRILSEIEDLGGNLKRAIAAYNAALTYYTPQTAPLDYALTQENVGLAYWDLAKDADKVQNLEQSIIAYKEALRYLTPEVVSYNYAKVQRNLGLAYKDLGDLPAALACWREAVHYYTQMGHTRDAETVQGWIDAAGE